MTKKKGRQADPGSPGGDDSSESSEENTQAVGKLCAHVHRSIDFSAVRKNVIKAQIKETCPDCSNESSKAPSPKLEESSDQDDKNKDSAEDMEGADSVWICLRCGFQGCGPPKRKSSHIAQHFLKPRSDLHALVANTDQWNVWCHECCIEFAANNTKKLHEVIDLLKRQNRSTTVTVILPRPKNVVPSSQVVEVTAEETVPGKEPLKRPGSKTVTLAAAPPTSPTNLPKVKGLSNLGNTCFFNAVLQCLAQTPFLVPLLRETSEEGELFYLAGCPEGGKDQAPVESLKGSLGKWGPLTEALTDTLTEMQEQGGQAVVTPRRLLNILSQKAPHLSQGDQQDSQELLRHLMEGVRAEELRRFQDKILTAVGLSRKTDPSSVDEEVKSQAKVYNHQASQLLLRPDQLFQGRLISTLQCQDCMRQSHTQEFFLDLSLPIASDRPQPPLVSRAAARREAENEPNRDKETPSKHQQKKERRQAHKNRKKSRGSSRQSSVEPAEGEEGEESKQSDADVEDNEEQEVTLPVPEEVLDTKPSRPLAIDALGVVHIETPDQGVDKNCVDDRGGGESGYATNGGTHSNSPGSPTSATEDIDPNHPTALCTELASLALEERQEEPEKKKEESSEDIKKERATESPELEGACALKTSPDPEDEEEENSQFWSQTLAPRPPPVGEIEGECSIQSCLNQFAALELLTGNNKVSCKTCTQRAGLKGGKTVCTNSTKQMLVSAPPAILTLHLKRFEVYGSRFRKVCRPVSFPLVLDLAPICSLKCRDLPTVGVDQTRLLYSLYGVVEHSGALSGGHYVAYVKARVQPDKDDLRYKFLLSNNWDSSSSSPSKSSPIHVQSPTTGLPNGDLNEDGSESGLPEPPPGKWYYVSDSRVSEVSEKKVLQTQAYLLFYERIF